jgi:hypothetical protein
MVAAQAIINYERTFIGKATYVMSAHGPMEFDCVGLQDYCCDHFGVLQKLVGDTIPYKVRWWFDHFTGLISYPGTQKPGDLLIMGWAGGTDDQLFAHIGMYSGNGKYISAYDPESGIVEWPIPAPNDDFTTRYVLHTNFSQEETMLDLKGTVTLLKPNSLEAAADLPSSDQAIKLLGTQDPTDRTKYIRPTVVSYSTLGYDPDTSMGPAFFVVDSGRVMYLLARNCFFTPS